MRRKKNQGQILIFVSLALLVLVAMLGLVVDGGWAYFRQQSAQAAADSAALAGAQAALFSSGGDLVCGASGVVCQAATACSSPVANPPASDADNACLYAQANGFAVTSGSKQNVLIEANTTSPPPTAPGVSDMYYVTARVSETFPLTFLAILGRLTQFISARATAVIGPRTQTCLYVLDPSGPASFTVNGANITSTCGFFVNSNHPTAMVVNGSSTINVSQIDIVGNYLFNGSNNVTPTPTTGVRQQGNPLAYLKPPNVGACTFPSTYVINGSTSVTLNPGVYCGGININGSNTVTFNQGTYILNGGGLTINGNNTVTGAGVTFYNTASSSQAYGAININESSTENLSAPTTGPLQGILFFQDPTVAGGNGSTVNGSGASTFNGVLYFPTTSLNYNGSGNSGGYTAIVAYDLNINGAASFNDNYPNGSPFKAVALVE